jgi:prepilin-type N-terminal cleavage/methylation domain-containing protein
MMNAQYHKSKGFSLIELLVVIAIISSLLAILYPSLLKARLQAKVLLVNHDLYQIGLALEAYEFTNGDWPPVRWDCMTERGHWYSLPPELVEGGYITGKRSGRIHYSDIEDKFYRGHSYKYMAVETALTQLGFRSRNIFLYVPTGFPDRVGGELVECKERKKSPVKWVLFSLGPGYDTKQIENPNLPGFPINSGFPFSQDFWYSQKKGTGILTRIKMLNHGDHIGTFRKNY